MIILKYIFILLIFFNIADFQTTTSVNLDDKECEIIDSFCVVEGIN
jgi:hypothetical protein